MWARHSDANGVVHWGAYMQFVVLLRGVNVGGVRVKMAQLCAACEAAGLRQVRSYIASGNLVLEADVSSQEVSRIVHDTIEGEFGLSIDVVALTAAAFGDLLSECPVEPEKGNMLHAFVPFGPYDLDQDKVTELKRDSDQVIRSASALWLYTPEGFGTSKLAERLPRLTGGTPITGRNLNTMRKLAEMLDARTGA